MGLTGGVKSHRLSGQILPYCEKKTSLALRVLRAYVFQRNQSLPFVRQSSSLHVKKWNGRLLSGWIQFESLLRQLLVRSLFYEGR